MISDKTSDDGNECCFLDADCIAGMHGHDGYVEVWQDWGEGVEWGMEEGRCVQYLP